MEAETRRRCGEFRRNSERWAREEKERVEEAKERRKREAEEQTKRFLRYRRLKVVYDDANDQ